MNYMSILLTALTAAGCWFVWRVLFWFREGRRMRTPGYLPPPPSWLGKMVYVWAANFAHWLAIGPYKVIGKENVPQNGRILILPNHQHGLDFAAVRKALPFAYRQIGALKEVTRVPGLAALSAWVGTFSVPVVGGKSTGGSGAANLAIEAVAKVLSSKASSDARQLVFPQGKLVFDNVLRPEDYRTGATRALKMAADMIGSGDELAVLPMAIHYVSTREQISFARKGVDWLWRKFFSGYGSGPKYGTVVAVGKPIPYNSLPKDPRQAIEMIRQRTQELLDIAVANS